MMAICHFSHQWHGNAINLCLLLYSPAVLIFRFFWLVIPQFEARMTSITSSVAKLYCNFDGNYYFYYKYCSTKYKGNGGTMSMLFIVMYVEKSVASIDNITKMTQINFLSFSMVKRICNC